MPQSLLTSMPTDVPGLPSCPKCGMQMKIARIEPDSPGYDRRTFECECGHSEAVVVKYR